MTANNIFPDYACLIIHTHDTAPEEAHDILSAVLGEYGFESFESEEHICKAYLKYSELPEALDQLLDSFPFIEHYTIEKIKGENWNKIWEENFQPVIIAGIFRIRADFHSSEEGYTEIIINPEMAFGTGHHPTTALCLELIGSLSLKGKTVIDVGCGTGILGIAASMSGASEVIAIDNDPVCLENTLANSLKNQRNNLKIVSWRLGLEYPPAHLLVANIQKNVLLEQMSWYALHVEKGGWLMMSGYRPEDHKDIELSAGHQGFRHIKTLTSGSWAASLFEKI